MGRWNGLRRLHRPVLVRRVHGAGGRCRAVLGRRAGDRSDATGARARSPGGVRLLADRPVADGRRRSLARPEKIAGLSGSARLAVRPGGDAARVDVCRDANPAYGRRRWPRAQSHRPWLHAALARPLRDSELASLGRSAGPPHRADEAQRRAGDGGAVAGSADRAAAVVAAPRSAGLAAPGRGGAESLAVAVGRRGEVISRTPRLDRSRGVLLPGSPPPTPLADGGSSGGWRSIPASSKRAACGRGGAAGWSRWRQRRHRPSATLLPPWWRKKC